VYHPDYNITACGIERCHPFDSCKYLKIHDTLLMERKVEECDFYRPKERCPRGLMLSLGVSKCYLLSLCYGLKVFKIVEVPVCFLPGAFIRQKMLNPMLYAT
jgi:histone deacetylase 11